MAYLNLNYHVVFSTKDRDPIIQTAWRPRLHRYLSRATDGLGGRSMGIGGTSDHVHLLFRLKATHRLCDVVREVKKASTRWIQRRIGERSFLWQGSYAAFTADWRGIPTLQQYIANQEEHHARVTFCEELKASLDEAGIEYDPRFLE